MSHLSQSDIVFGRVENIGMLRRFQRAIRTLTGLVFDFVDLGARHSARMRAEKNYCDFCRLVHGTPAGDTACEDCTARAVKLCRAKGKPVIQTCHMGLKDVYLPMIVYGRTIGVLTTGQLLFRLPTAADLARVRRRAKALGLDTAAATAALAAVPLCPKEKLDAVIELLEVLTQYTTDAADRLLAFGDLERRDPLRRAREHIEQHYAAKLTLVQVAQVAHLSPSRLGHLFREKLGTRFVAYLNNVRLDKTLFLLENSGLAIAEAAYQAGFTSLSHFNHLFKRRFGVAPTRHLHRRSGTTPAGG